MKSAMQELIEWVNNDLKLLGYEHPEIYNKASELLEKEKQQIQVAYLTGKASESINTEINSNDYYTQTYLNK